MKETKRFRIHRFYDSVALSIGTSDTIYLPISVANELIKGLKMCVDNINDSLFTDSNFNEYVYNEKPNKVE